MMPEEKQLLHIDICARFPYGVICQLSSKIANCSTIEKLELGVLEYFLSGGMSVKPYLRPMSSMTEDERKELCELCEFFEPYNDRDDFSHYGIEIIEEFCVNDEKIPLREINYEVIDWLNAHHFDYRGLIEKGLAIEAPEGMYN